MSLLCIWNLEGLLLLPIILIILFIDLHCFVFYSFWWQFILFFSHNISSTNVCQCGLDSHRTMNHPTSRHENANLLLDNIFTVRPSFLYKMKVIFFKDRTNNSVCFSHGCTPPPSAKKHPRHTGSHWWHPTMIWCLLTPPEAIWVGFAKPRDISCVLRLLIHVLYNGSRWVSIWLHSRHRHRLILYLLLILP